MPSRKVQWNSALHFLLTDTANGHIFETPTCRILYNCTPLEPSEPVIITIIIIIMIIIIIIIIIITIIIIIVTITLNITITITTCSNQRLWECVRCRTNVYPDTLNDFPSWLSTSKNQPCFINNRGFTERYFSDKVHASLMIEDCVAWRRQFP